MSTTQVMPESIVVRDNLVPPRLGSAVLYVLAERDSVSNPGKIRPAIVVDLVDDGSAHGLVSLQVFTNGGFDQLAPVHHCKNIVHDEETHKPGTWHWPPPRELVFKSVPVDTQLPPAPEANPFPDAIAATIKKKGYHVSEPPPKFVPEVFAKDDEE